MAFLESVAAGVAKSIITKGIEKGIKYITSSKLNEYKQALMGIIERTCEKYAKQYPIQETTEGIPFYTSEALIQLLLEFRFTKQLDKDKIASIPNEDTRILPPTEEQLNLFFSLFDEELESNQEIKNLSVEHTYKEEIFDIADSLKSFRNEFAALKKDISLTNVSNTLVTEWNKQIDEIGSDLNSFKAKTAKNRLERLEERIRENEIVNDNLYARLYNLLAQTLALFDDEESKEKQAKLYIRISKLSPLNETYKGNAALGYYMLGEFPASIQIAEELLAKDEFNVVGWIIKCLTSDNILEAVSKIPSLVKKKDLFKLNVYNLLASRKQYEDFNSMAELGISTEVDTSKPTDITYRNIRYQHLLSQFLMNYYFNSNRELLSHLDFPKAKDSDQFMYAYRILEASAKALCNTEIEEYYRDYEFHYYCCKFIINRDKQDINEMERVFLLMKEHPLDVVVRMMQGYNTLGTEDAFNKSIELGESELDKHEQKDFILIMLSGTSVAMQDRQRQTQYFLQYLQTKTIFNADLLYNFTSFIRRNGVEVTQETKNGISNYIQNVLYSNEGYKYIMQFFCYQMLGIGTFTDEQLESLINKAEDEIKDETEEVKIHIAYAYALIKKENEAIGYIRTYIDLSRQSESYILYCKVLYSSNGNGAELLELLKKQREKFIADFSLLQMELTLMELQAKTKESVKIARKGIELFPKSEYFIKAFFVCLNNDVQLEEVKKHSFLVKDFPFKDEGNVVLIVQILLRAEMYQDALELHFKYASKKNSTQARQAFFMLSYHYPKGTFKEFDEVTVGTTVKFSIGGQTYYVPITEQYLDDPKQSLLFGKKANETFSVQKKFSGILETGQVLRIMDNYLALFEEVMEESKDPLSTMPIQSFEVKGESFEEMTSSFIEALGSQGTATKERIDKEHEKYYAGKISFGEISSSVFHRNFIDAYFILTNNNGKPFRAISPAIGTYAFPNDANFVLDATSLCLFFLLEDENNITFTHKFTISPFLRQMLVHEYEETKRNDYNLTLSVTVEKVEPHFYDENFKERRLNTFSKLIKWVDDNCEMADIPERVDFVKAIKDGKPIDLYFNIYLDNRLLIDREKYYLLTNDLFYLQQFKTDRSYALSPICYLGRFHPSQQKTYTMHMLQRNYIGVPLTSEILNDEFLKMLSGQANQFANCMENLKYAWNPEPQNIGETILFLKNLYTTSFVSSSTREQTTQVVFQNLSTGMPQRQIGIVDFLLEREFKFLGLHKDRVLQIFRSVTGT